MLALHRLGLALDVVALPRLAASTAVLRPHQQLILVAGAEPHVAQHLRAALLQKLFQLLVGRAEERDLRLLVGNLRLVAVGLRLVRAEDGRQVVALGGSIAVTSSAAKQATIVIIKYFLYPGKCANRPAR